MSKESACKPDTNERKGENMIWKWKWHLFSSLNRSKYKIKQVKCYSHWRSYLTEWSIFTGNSFCSLCVNSMLQIFCCDASCYIFTEWLKSEWTSAGHLFQPPTQAGTPRTDCPGPFGLKQMSKLTQILSIFVGLLQW